MKKPTNLVGFFILVYFKMRTTNNERTSPSSQFKKIASSILLLKHFSTNFFQIELIDIVFHKTFI